MVTLTTILARHSDQEIVDRLIELYPDLKDSAEGYHKVLGELRSLEPAQRDYMKIEVSQETDEDEEYYHVSGIVGGDELSYALEFTPWNEWLAMYFTTDSLKYPEVDLIAHCLWEMTWSGFDQEEIREKYNKIVETAEEIEKNH